MNGSLGRSSGGMIPPLQPIRFRLPGQSPSKNSGASHFGSSTSTSESSSSSANARAARLNGRGLGSDAMLGERSPGHHGAEYHSRLNLIESNFAALVASGKLKRVALSTPATATPANSQGTPSTLMSPPSSETNNSVNRDELEFSTADQQVSLDRMAEYSMEQGSGPIVTCPTLAEQNPEHEMVLSATFRSEDNFFAERNGKSTSLEGLQSCFSPQRSYVKENSAVVPASGSVDVISPQRSQVKENSAVVPVICLPSNEPAGCSTAQDSPSFGSPEVTEVSTSGWRRRAEDEVAVKPATSSLPQVESCSSPQASNDIGKMDNTEQNSEGLNKMLGELEPLLEQMLDEMEVEQQVCGNGSCVRGSEVERRPVIAALATMTKTIWDLTARNERLSTENMVLQQEASSLRAQLQDRKAHESEVAVQTD